MYYLVFNDNERSLMVNALIVLRNRILTDGTHPGYADAASDAIRKLSSASERKVKVNTEDTVSKQKRSVAGLEDYERGIISAALDSKKKVLKSSPCICEIIDELIARLENAPEKKSGITVNEKVPVKGRDSYAQAR